MSLARYIDTLNLLGDESRIRLCALLRDRELCVSDLVRVTGIAQSRVSTHLGRLRDAGFLLDRKKGTQSFYALATDRLPETARAFLDEAQGSGDPTLEGDQQRLFGIDAEHRGDLPEADQIELEYSPGRSWHSLAVGLAGLLDLGDVLDAGSGDGAAASTILPYCRSLTCIDINARNVDAVKKRLGKHARVHAQVADVQALPFGDESFDAVMLFHTLTYTEHPSRALAECARVLRRGGRLVLLCLDQHKQLAVTARYGERHPGFTPRALKQMLARAGLNVSSCGVACRESKKPHLHVVLAAAEKLPSPKSKTTDGSRNS